MSKQILLDLGLAPDYCVDAFIAGLCNEEARAALQNVPHWVNNALVIVGRKGSGKTHLGHIWANNNSAISLDGNDNIRPHSEWEGQALWIDNASSADEFTLFTLINMAITSKLSALLLTDRDSPITWPVQIPDLHSRLRNLQTARLEQADDKLLSAIIEKLFKDRGLKVSTSLVAYLLANTDRSVNSLRVLIAKLDREAAAKKVNVTRKFAAKYLQRNLL